jgi:hypothetical protein
MLSSPHVVPGGREHTNDRAASKVVVVYDQYLGHATTNEIGVPRM